MESWPQTIGPVNKMRIYAPQPHVSSFEVKSSETQPNSKNWIGQLIWLMVAIVIAFLHINNIILNSTILQLKEITVQGNDHYPRDKIIDSAKLYKNRDLIHQVSEKEVESRIEKLNYIKKATVSKHYLRKTVSINITERKKTAKIPCIIGKKPVFMIVDQYGYVLEYSNLVDLSHDPLVEITGEGAELGSQLISNQVQIGLKTLDLIKKRAGEIFTELNSIDASEPNRISVRLRNMPLILLSSDQLVLGINQLKLFYQHLKREKSVNKQTGTYLDFRFKGAVYLMERKQDGN